jgi:ribosomal-protein-serine acetyltransferase
LKIFKALRSRNITLYLITNENQEAVRAMFEKAGDAYTLSEFEKSYLPEFDDERRQEKYGFYSTLDGELAGLSLLGVSSFKHKRGYTGADTLPQMRGKGVAPNSKPHLFYLGFELLGLNRIETGCFVSNTASRRSIEKTFGFEFEGILRKYALNENGEFEDERRYAILRKDWQKLYDKNLIEIIAED